MANTVKGFKIDGTTYEIDTQQANSSTIGGIKANKRDSSYTNEVKIDEKTGVLYSKNIIIASSEDITEDSTLDTGVLYCVYEE
jgi:hypothetical protein